MGIYETLEAAGFAPDPEDTLFAEHTCSYNNTQKAIVSKTIEILASGKSVTEDNQASLTLRFLHDYGQHHFEKPMKSYAFLKSLLDINQ